MVVLMISLLYLSAKILIAQNWLNKNRTAVIKLVARHIKFGGLEQKLSFLIR